MRKVFLTVVAIMMLGILSCTVSFAAGTKVTMKPTTDTRKVTVTVNAPKSVLKKTDKYKFVAKMYNGKKVVQTKKGTINLKKNNKKGKSFTFPYYGKWKVTGYLYKKSKKVKTFKTRTLKIKASEYNIVQYRSTTPVLVTTLKFLGDDTYTTGAKGQVIPTIVTLGRDKQYNWNKLPKDWYKDPLDTSKTSKTKRLQNINTYVKMLHDISPKATFHIYGCDYHINELSGALYQSGISENNMTLTMVTDGASSYACFRRMYADVENAQEVHENLKADYIKYRTAMKKGKDYKPKYNTGSKGYPLKNYTYAILDVENECGVKTEWWVVRKGTDTFDIRDTAFQSAALADERISNNYINGLLSKLQEGSNEEIFKALYNFDDSMIKESIRNGRKPMMILGTSKWVEPKVPVAPFIRYTKLFYGDEYDYFYKGHPGYITEEYPERMAEMASLGCKVLDSSIAAELFEYYNPGLYMSGYQTSTFQNIGGPENHCGLYNIRKADAISNTALMYAPNMDFFIINMSEVKDEDIKALVSDPSHDNYLVEFSDAMIEKTGDEIAIWDDTDQTESKYYKDSSGNYQKR